ncbi:MAG TPA: toxin-antitoxin system HicB family antitoxin [Phototrophicaceae bacterium]|nr:toxin-antitoxin system HicB family antitoxin [Phototrophicaceae bacterium]
MVSIRLRLPKSLHDAIRELAKEDNVSIHQFITLALAEKVSALKTEEYRIERGSHGSRAKFEAALAKVASVQPDESDRLS